MKRIYQIKQIDKKQPLTFLCGNAQQFQQYTTGISNQVFRKVKSIVPGPYTFIFEASKKIPKVLLTPRAVIGVRIPKAKVVLDLLDYVGEPILSSSVPLNSDEVLYYPYDIHSKYGKVVDCVVDCGELYPTNSAIIDFSVDPPEIIREGDVDLSWINS